MESRRNTGGEGCRLSAITRRSLVGATIAAPGALILMRPVVFVAGEDALIGVVAGLGLGRHRATAAGAGMAMHRA